jgi:hypothetical protein
MANEAAIDAVERLRHSRAQIVALAKELRGDTQPASSAFPRSAIMRAATGSSGRALLGCAALGLALLRPGLFTTLERLAPIAPLLRSVVKRYVVRRIFR